jgi:hypothetical protein
VHTLVKNSPFVRATCGPILKVSETVMHAGQYAQYNDLEWIFDLRHSSSLNLEVLSVYYVLILNCCSRIL